MTWTLKVRGAPNQPKVVEYMCPKHGRFEMTTANPPDAVSCGYDLDDEVCQEICQRVISAPNPRIVSVVPTAAVRGGDTERRPGMLDTRPLAEGMPMKEWRKVQKKHTEERRHHELIKKGLKTPRIQSR